MSIQIIDGKKIAAEIRAEIKKEITELGIAPGLAVILVGADPASHLYVGLKEKAAAEVGIHFEKYLFFATEPEEKIIAKIQELNERPDIHGIVVQLPLPQGYDENKIVAAIDPKKDADGFHPENIKKILAGEPENIPPVISGILKLIESTGTELVNKKIAILANSEILAKPLEKILTGNDIKTIIAPETLTTEISDADIVITALGRAKIITADAIKPGAILIDVGTTRMDDGTTVGDIDFESAATKACFITPVPGGVGPMTVAELLRNVLNLAK
ncbi:bifunctional 5,10-methylenetetrahydrofolate dehydrogenase/5,10-methenyltetrahydrofolate cyclohydrolase [Candidatus Falkowbacteria bacterium]|nr:bifunctional 5,10-methylenetetrahydrofolate dehydrogenase/5,10-methenyltetrahydrofolate cyclohydrolase [Candidatus Falkowbacteria bacterium]